MRIGHLGVFLLPLALSAAPAAAQPSIDVDVNLSMPGEPVGSVDVFYDQLSPYGVWVDDSDLGRVYMPEQNDYVPYTNGHWEYTDLGFVWVSTEPFAWATSHYGRWAYSQPYSRWVWMPDTTWGPSWVDWRESDGEFGWAPLAPQVVVDLGYQQPIEAWHFCPAERVLDVNVGRYYAPRDRVVVIERQARPIESRRRINNREVIAGPPAAKLQEHKVVARVTKVDTRKVGLMSATEARAATQRAEQRKATVLAANEKRVESNAKLREQQQQAKTRPRGQRIEAKANEPKQPARPEVKQPEPRNEKPAPRAEVKPEPKQPRIDTKAKPTEPKPAPRAEVKPEPKQPAPAPRAEVKPEPKPEPRADNRREQPAPAPRAEPKQPPRAETRPEAKPEPKPAPHAETKPAPEKRPQQAENRAQPKRDDKKRDDNKRD